MKNTVSKTIIITGADIYSASVSEMKVTVNAYSKAGKLTADELLKSFNVNCESRDEYGFAVKDIEYVEQLRVMDIDKFVDNAHEIEENQSRKNMVTRTIKVNVWNVYTVENGQLVKHEVRDNRERTKKEMQKRYPDTLIEFVTSYEYLAGVSNDFFYEYSEAISESIKES